MSHQEIREKFFDYFKKRGHKIIPSSSLLSGDPSVLFTSAGMQQFKKYYLNLDSPYGNRVASIQKCLRTSDIEEVGDETHLTFFEMLGNFSFKWPEGENSYFKKEAINFAYDFIINELKIPLEKIKITIFGGDKENNIPEDRESLEIWKSLKIPKEKIFFGTKEDNFWGPTGEEGPCGPTTEIHIISPFDQNKSIEIWNIVFNEYYCDKKNHLVSLERKGIDTGMGFERLAMILQNSESVFETDLFQPIITEIRGKNLYDYEINKKYERIIADHLKASVFLISEGLIPSNIEQGYILRRLIRRAIRFLKILNLNLKDNFWGNILKTIIKIYKNYYEELEKNYKYIVNILEEEYHKFDKVLSKGLKEFEKIKKGVINRGGTIISGADAFHLYQSFGFPIELTKELAEENNLKIDLEDFIHHQKEHKRISGVSQEKKFGGHGLTNLEKIKEKERIEKIIRLHTATHLLQASLIELFGKNIRQEGSDITEERLRFDFSFPRKLTKEEIKKVEERVNELIKMNLEVSWEEMKLEEAINSGALAFFKEKYPEKVRVYKIGNKEKVFSKEICGGPHVKNTSEVGRFKIIKEEAIASGIRRIKAIVY